MISEKIFQEVFFIDNNISILFDKAQFEKAYSGSVKRPSRVSLSSRSSNIRSEQTSDITDLFNISLSISRLITPSIKTLIVSVRGISSRLVTLILPTFS